MDATVKKKNQGSLSLTRRVLMAILLMIGFYCLALGIAGLLVYLPYAEVVYAHRLHPQLALVCVVGAIAILYSIVPRIDRFRAPGPVLKVDEHPRLFRMLREVARDTRQPLPAEVYVELDVNAWVAQRGGLMGLGSRRVMGIGLPLTAILTVSEFRAVLVHEFGHYYGGDVWMAPWVYKTRSMVIRTVNSLKGIHGLLEITRTPFVWYGKMFLQATQAVSRRQEFVADELAARTVGARYLVEGLKKIHANADVFTAYWDTDVAMVLGEGFIPPILDGFRMFLQSEEVASLVAESLKRQLNDAETGIYDSHPPLRERIAAVSGLMKGEEPSGGPLAVSLFDDVPSVERAMVEFIAGKEVVVRLQPITWEEVGERVLVPVWRRMSKADPSVLAGIVTNDLPVVLTYEKGLAERFRRIAGRTVPTTKRVDTARHWITAALALALVNRGWHAESLPGQPVILRKDGWAFPVFREAVRMSAGEVEPSEWERQCRALGIADVDLGRVAADSAS